MKKLIALLLAAILCFSLGACDGKTQTSSNSTQTSASSTQQKTEQGVQTDHSTNEQTAAVVVHITINPEFKIHVDDEGNVFEVECLNDDAKAVNDKVSVMGKSCKDAIVLILNESAQQGFLKDGGDIRITVSVANEISNQLDTWNNTVMDAVTQALTENTLDNVNIAFVDDSWEPPKEENSEPSDPIPPENKGEDSSDDNVVTETDANGNTIIRDENGVITIVDKDDKIIQILYLDNNGGLITQNYDESGNLVSEEREPPGKAELFAGETIIYANDSGYQSTNTFGENGQLLFNREEFSDGTFLERYYYENGVLSREYDFRADSTYVDISYDINGNRTTANSKQADGSVWELAYNADGSYYGYTYYPDGSVWYNEWDAGHNQNFDAQKQIK